MIDLPQLQLIAQLMDNMDISVKELEKSYNENNSERFTRAKQEIFDIHDKIGRLV